MGRAYLARAALDPDATRWAFRRARGTRTAGRGHACVLPSIPCIHLRVQCFAAWYATRAEIKKKERLSSRTRLPSIHCHWLEEMANWQINMAWRTLMRLHR